MYMIYTDSENMPPPVHSALDDMSNCTGMKVSDMMAKVVKTLDKATAGSRHNPVEIEDGDPMQIDSDMEPEESDDPLDYESDAGAWSPRSPKHQSSNTAAQVRPGARAVVQASNARIRSDLRLAKEAGFRVSCLGNLLNNGVDGFVTLSCRVAKLGISDEALQAWHLEPTQYFILLVRYTNGYRDFDSLIGQELFYGNNAVQMRVGLSSRYKVAIDEAIAAFAVLEDKSKSRKLLSTQSSSTAQKGDLGRIFIGKPLDDLLNDRLVPLLRYRNAMGFGWDGAENFFNDHQGRNIDSRDAMDPKYWVEDSSSKLETLPKFVIQDHMTSRLKERSFPLTAMQFALRHLVRCTEFCLVCSCKVEADFEALKPYVCSKPLCLYQYMNLGFGPSIEHEIITQPHVVDLLISFCYSSVSYRSLRYLPSGMALMVPALKFMPEGQISDVGYGTMRYPPLPIVDGIKTYQPAKVEKVPPKTTTHRAKFDRQKMELWFSLGAAQAVYRGQWITFIYMGLERFHCRVDDVMHPMVRLAAPVTGPIKKTGKHDQPIAAPVTHRHLPTMGRANVPTTMTPASTPPPMTTSESSINLLPEIEFIVYDQNFDDLSDLDKQQSIYMLLETLPSVRQMADFLRSKGGQDTSLRQWTERISPAALGILRWIIASNRSCIIQVDSLEGGDRKPEERVSGMPGWMQFRFAQGAPDKEQRFMTSIRDTKPNTKHSTIFAWHGSPLRNWHGIVREGLHFERTDHGRAFGNGVYHSLHASTSVGYSSNGNVSRGLNSGDESVSAPGEWPHSRLKISQAIALNEIVNAPSQFVSKYPHLVVAQLDWIQSRYLFVRCNTEGLLLHDIPPTQVYEQDPSYTPFGEKNSPIVMPVTAVAKSRRPVSQIVTVKSGNKKIKVANEQELEEVTMVSDETDSEDLEIFFSEAEENQEHPPSQSNKGKDKALPELPSSAQSHTSQTDFVPGSLNPKSLPLLEPPTYATSMATRAIQRELTATLKVQDTHPADELGWYIDRELVNNVYQWIVELHSFERHLPLAKDMKSKGIKSVVMEIRFGDNYPMSPPFIRVIRPRFLSFMAGGGGHVTAGGALCMELLTNSGWSAVSNIESVLLQVRLAISSTDPKPARLEAGPVRDYQVGEAVEAFIRACHAHGVSYSS